MGKAFLNNQQQGIILLIAAAIMWAPLPNWLPWQTIGALAVLLLGIYNLFR